MADVALQPTTWPIRSTTVRANSKQGLAPVQIHAPLLIEQPHDGEQHPAQIARFMLFGPSAPGLREPFGHRIGGLRILAVHSQNVTFRDAF